MGLLAEELAVNRVTLYRWVGSRDQLLVDVLWSLAEGVLADATAKAPPRGSERVVGTVVGFLDQVITAPGMQHFLATEGELALRLLTRADRGFQPRLIAAVRNLLVEEDLELPVELDELAFVIVRVIETYTYLDLITGEQPTADRAEPILRLLLR
jgi:AcrR family transcriptional regulator